MQPDKDNAPRLIIDLNSILNGALLGGKDPDALTTIVEGKVVSVNSARYGVDKFFARFVEVLREFNAAPRNVIGVWDGKNAKAFRQGMLPAYKSSTRTGPEYEQLNEARTIVSQMLHDMGAHTVVCDGCEADDTIAYLVQRLRTRKNIVVTGDGDLMVLVDDNTHVFRQGKLDENPYGPFPHKYITVYKALVGDTSDKIPGAKGFGDAAFVKMVAAFGVDGLEAMEDILRRGAIKSLEEDVADLPVLKKIIDNEAEVMNSWRAARIYPDRVNTLRRPLQWRAGMVKQWHSLAEDDRVADLKGYYGTCTLVHAGNYEQLLERLAEPLGNSPFVALDIETSVPEESLDWLELTKSKGGAGVKVDVLGSKLTGMSLTFGKNLQHTVYVTVDHREEADLKNVTSEQCRRLVELVPQSAHLVIQNAGGFELPVLRAEWNEAWKDNGWHGFLPNAIDTKIGASYVNENYPLGLKQRSKLHLNYEQQTYEETTVLRGPVGSLPEGGRRLRSFQQVVKAAVVETVATREVDSNGDQVFASREVAPAVTEEWEERSYQMNELTARHVFSYGCDDTVTCSALHTWYRVVMEMEHTWHTYLQVEQLPAYLTALAFMQGIPIDLGRLRQMEKEDRAALAEHERVLHEFLIAQGWDGTVCPEYSEADPASVKEAVNIVLGPPAGEEEFTTRKRKLDAIALEIEQKYPDNETASLLARAIRAGDAVRLTKEVSRRFDGKPKINFGSPKQMRTLLYDRIGMQMRVFNKLTDKQREDEDFRRAFYSKRDFDDGKITREPTEFERGVWLSKVSTDDDAVELALFRDNLPEDRKAVLNSFLKIKEINTRISLFYNTYTVVPHWKTGRIHSSMNQCEAVTRRYSSSNPNLQQLPSRGEGVKFRTLLPAPKDWVYVSMDFSSQELLLMAQLSQDENMKSCFDPKLRRDIHSLTAASASAYLWERAVTYDEFMEMRKSDDKEIAAKAAALRAGGKTTNFATQFGAQAPKVAIQLKTDEETAQQFIEAKDATFPGINIWKAKVEGEAAETGLAFTMLGVPRHLREQMISPMSHVRSRAARQSSNHSIQGSAAEMTKLSLSRMWSSGIFSGGLRAQFACPIHDEAQFLAHRDDALEAIKVVHAAMTAQYANMELPINSSIAIGRDFSCPIEIGEVVDESKICEAIESLFGEVA